MRESKRSSTGTGDHTCRTAILKPIDFMKKCAEHLQYYINCYTHILLYLTISVMLYTCFMQQGVPLYVTEDSYFKAGIYLHGTVVAGSASKYHMLHIPCYLCTEMLVYRLNLAALRTASVDCAK